MIISCSPSSNKDTYQSKKLKSESISYDVFYDTILKLEKKECYDSALILVEDNFDQYLEQEFELMKELEYLYRKTEQYEKSLDLYAQGHEKGYFFLLHPSLPKCAPYIEYDRFNDLVKKDTELRSAALEKAKTIYDVQLPENYDPAKRYRVFLILHGGGSSLSKAKERWKIPDELKDKMITAYVQSYLYYDSNTFGWRSYDERARKDISRIYHEIVTDYAIDTTSVYIGGMSAGGIAAMDFAINQIIPVKGVFGVCPGKPQEFDAVNVSEANKSGLKIMMVAGENDPYRPKQEEMISVFEEENIPYTYIIIPEMGHDIPEDLSERWVEAMQFFN